MNPILWIIIALFTVDALREYLGQPSLPALCEYIYTLAAQWVTI
jgi:hypothetical protein